MSQKSKDEFRYNNQLIIWVCENYECLSKENKMPTIRDDYGTIISFSKVTGCGSFVKPADLVADIDRAIKDLKPKEKGIIIGRLIDKWDTETIASWYNLESWLDVLNIEQYAVRKMKRYLNGDSKHNDQKSEKKALIESQKVEAKV
jgi:hypothetical protein